MHACFKDALLSTGPAADRAEQLKLYGRFIGSWSMKSVIHPDAGGQVIGPDGEIHFAWTLEGRAIQDVWVLPQIFYGTTLRVYDPGIHAWHIFWSDPTSQIYTRQIGRAEDEDIVQIGDDGKGTRLRWRFAEITPKSFHWIGERAAGAENDWRKQIEMFARRVY